MFYQQMELTLPWTLLTKIMRKSSVNSTKSISKLSIENFQT